MHPWWVVLADSCRYFLMMFLFCSCSLLFCRYEAVPICMDAALTIFLSCFCSFLQAFLDDVLVLFLQPFAGISWWCSCSRLQVFLDDVLVLFLQPFAGISWWCSCRRLQVFLDDVLVLFLQPFAGMRRGRPVWRQPLFVLALLAVIVPCSSIGRVRLKETNYVVQEGNMLMIEILKTGIAATDIQVAVEVNDLLCNFFLNILLNSCSFKLWSLYVSYLLFKNRKPIDVV